MTDIETGASFSIYAGDLSIDVVNGALGVRPDRATAKGTVRSDGHVRQMTHWSLQSKDRVVGVDADAHLRDVLDRIEPAAAGLAALRVTYPELVTRAWVFWDQNIALADCVVAPETLARLAALDTEWSTSIRTSGTEKFTDDEEDVIGAAGLTADGTVIVDSAAEVGSILLADHVRFLLAELARSGTPVTEVVLTWILARDNSDPKILREQVAELAALGAPVRFVIGVRPYTATDLEAWASFSVYAGDLNLVVVYDALGVWPDDAAAKGRVRSNGRVQKMTHWALSSDGRVAGFDPDEHLGDVLDRIEPAAPGLAALRAAHPEVAARMWIFWSQDIALAEFTIAAATVARFAALGAEWSTSIMTPFTEEFTDDEEDVIGAAAVAVDGTVVVDSEGEVGSILLDDHVRFLLAELARSGTPVAEIVFTWILALDNSHPEILHEQVAGLAALGAPVRFVIGARA